MNILEARRRMLGADVYKKTVQGNPVSVRSLARMRPGLKVFGRSAQDTTTGAQLIPFELGAEMTSINGVTKCIPKKDGFHIELDGISTGSSMSDICFLGGINSTMEDSYDEYENLPAGTYYGRISNLGYFLYVIVWRDGSNKSILATNTNGSFEVQEGDKFRIFIRPSVSVAESGVVQAIISKQNDSVMYEPYTGGKPSPSTDYPQEITSVGDDGEIEVTMVNDGYVEKGMALNIIKKIALKKGSYIYCKNQIKSSIMNAFIVNDPDLIATSGGAISNGNSLHSYCYNNLGMVTIEKSGTTITKNARIYQYWESGVVYRIDSDGLYLYYSINNSSYNDTEDGFVWFLDHEGSKERPYTSQSLTVQTPNGLPGIPVTSGGNYTDSTGQQWVCDEIDFKRGKYVQRVKKVVIDSSFLIVQQPNASNQFAINVRKELGEIASVRNPVVANIARTAIPIDAPHPAQIFQYEFFIYWYGADIFPDVQSFKDWLDTDGNTFYVIGQLATPIETDLTPEQMAAYESLHTNRPTTVVSATDGAGLELTYKTKKSLEVTA